MKISQIEIYKSSIKLREPFITSLGKHDAAQNVIVIVKTDSGITGLGECSPFLTINGESIDTGFIVGQYLAKALLKTDPLDMANVHKIMDATVYSNSSIKSAIDIALYDIASQYAGSPLYKFLGGEKNKQLIIDYTVSLDEADKMANDAVKIKDKGYQIIKVKLGDSGAKDVERIKAIRKAIGNDIILRIDANQGWNTEEAIHTLKALEPFKIQHCEEPIPRWNFMELSKVKAGSLIPIMADESVCDHHDAQRLVNLNACDSFNIKLGKSGGLFKAQKIIKIAEAANMNLQIGGFLESRIGFTASAHLALSSDNIIYCDFDTPLMFVEDPVVGGIKYGKNGVVEVPESPGLGAAVNPDYLKRMESVIIS